MSKIIQQETIDEITELLKIGITQDNISERTGVSISTIKRIKSNICIDKKEQEKKDKIAEATRRYMCGQELLDEWDRECEKFRKKRK